MKFDRRLLLKAALGAPLLRTLMPEAAFAAPTPAPKRIVFWFQPNGVVHRHYHVRPNSTETDWGYDPAGDLHTLLPLAPFKDLTVHFDAQQRVSTLAEPDTNHLKWTDAAKLPFGLTDLAGCAGPNPLKPPDANGNPTREFTVGHESQIAMLTGRYPVGRAVNSTTVEWDPQGDSIDVALGNALGASTRIKSIQLGMNSQVSNFTLSYAAGQRQPITENPRNSFDTLFTGIPRTPGVDPQAEALRKKMNRRKSSFEAAYARYRELEGHLRTPDRTRLRQHLDAYRDVEARLTQAPDLTNLACHSPDEPAANLNLGDPLTYPARMQLMTDQAVLALACDVTRVVTLAWTFSATNQVFSFLPGFTAPVNPDGSPSPDGHHPLSHDAYDGINEPVTQSQLAALDKKRRIERWYAERLAAFLTALQNVREPDGSTLMDNTVVVVLNEINHSGAHNNSNMPIRLYGGLKGAIRTGRYLPLPTTPLNDLYVSLANALGVPWTTFGQERFDYKYGGNQTNWQTVSESKVVGPIPGLTS
jgi:hypothetical protein